MRESHPVFASFLAAAIGLAACGGDDTGGSNGGAGNGGASTGGTTSEGGHSMGGTTSQGGHATGGTTSEGGFSMGGVGGGATGGSGGAEEDLSALDDEFDDPATLASWTLLHEELGAPPPYDLLDIDTTVPGKLAITPLVSSWYMEQMATFLYKEVSGDFVVEVDAAAYKKGTVNGAPTEIFNSGGLLVRDPASGPGAQRWVMYNIGHQDQFIGVEGKVTTNSQSELILIPTNGAHAGRLRICRVGASVHMLRRLPGEASWTESHTFPGSFQTPAFTLPDVVQVGIIDNAYTVADVRVEMEYIHFRRVTSAADCSAD